MKNEIMSVFSSFYLTVEDSILLKKWTKFIRLYVWRSLSVKREIFSFVAINFFSLRNLDLPHCIILVYDTA
jgi:hypothetical protein